MVSIKKTGVAISFLTICLLTGCSLTATPGQDVPMSESAAVEKSNTPEASQENKESDSKILRDDKLISDLSLENLPITEKENQFSVEDIIIDKSYTIEIVTAEYVSGSEEDALAEMFSHCSLIGYDDEYVYLLHGEEDEYIISRVNYVSKSIEIGIYGFQSNLQFSKYVKDGYIYIGYSEVSEYGDRIQESTLKQLNLKNGINEITEKVVFQTHDNQYPAIVYSDKYITITHGDDSSYILSCIDYETLTVTEIYRAGYFVDEHNLYTGEIPVYGNATEQGVYFQMLSYNSEMFDFEGSQSLYYYSFASGKCKPILKLSDKITYVNGSEEIILINNYSVDDARAQTGKIISLKDNTIITIPKTNPANGITNSVIYGDLVFASSNENLFVYTISEKTLSSIDIEKNGRSGRAIYNSTFGVLKKEEDSIRFSIVQYKGK